MALIEINLNFGSKSSFYLLTIQIIARVKSWYKGCYDSISMGCKHIIFKWVEKGQYGSKRGDILLWLLSAYSFYN